MRNHGDQARSIISHNHRRSANIYPCAIIRSVILWCFPLELGPQGDRIYLAQGFRYLENKAALRGALNPPSFEVEGSHFCNFEILIVRTAKAL